MRYQIQNPNESGQGFCPDHKLSPLSAIARQCGYRYSHSTNVENDTVHSYKHGEHSLAIVGAGLQWSTKTSCAAHRSNYGHGEKDLASHLARKSRRHNLASK